jgi:alanyl-tRNA synthetase
MGDDDVSMRVLADHARAATFLIADGVLPSNEGRGYVLRRIMRRAIRHGVRLGLAEGDYGKLCERVIATMSPAYPELREAQGLIARAVDAEDQGFRRTIDRGMKLLDEAFSELTRGGEVPGEVVFKLYDTYGFPADLTRVIAEERGFTVDETGFEKHMEEQRARSADFSGSGEQVVADVYKDLARKHGATKFLGYQATDAECTIVEVITHKDSVEIVSSETPFYGESGGQVGDTGRIEGANFAVEVTDTQKPGGELIVHKGKVVRGTPAAGRARFIVDVQKRDATRRNHSATHLLHWALRKVLGEHVTQKGSLVAPDRLRFDFSHFQPLTDDEKHEVEMLVNEEILKNRDSRVDETSFDEARKLGAMALFGEKYGDRVRVMRIGDHSVELCGGTHVARAGDIGLFKITQETGIAQGVRRLEAQTGAGALAYVRRMEDELLQAAAATRAPLFQVAAQVERLQRELKERERRIEELQRKLAGGGGRDLVSEAREVAGIKVLSSRTDVGDPKALREVADQLRNKLKSGVVVLGGVGDGKVALVAAVTADLVDRVHAGKIIGEVAKLVGGKGGGKPDLAQGGGTDPSKLDEALAAVYKLVT